jgi:hypothetical protein
VEEEECYHHFIFALAKNKIIESFSQKANAYDDHHEGSCLTWLFTFCLAESDHANI